MKKTSSLEADFAAVARITAEGKFEVIGAPQTDASVNSASQLDSGKGNGLIQELEPLLMTGPLGQY